MNVLVLGGNGFLGSHLVDKLVFEGHDVTVFDRYREYYRQPLNHVKYIYADFGNREAVEKSLKNIDYVYHLICTTHPKVSNDDPIFDVSSNVIETLHLLESCRNQNILKIVFISSGGTIYGIPNTVPIKEESQTNPICSYGITKLAIEKYIMLFNYLHDLDYTIIRPSNPYGERQNPYSIQGVIPVFMGKIAAGKDIEVWGNGEVIRDYIYVKDLVNGIYLASVSSAEIKTFNIGSGMSLSINDIIKMIFNVTQMDFNVSYFDSRVYDIPEIELDINRARQYLNWSPTVHLKDGLAKTWEFIKNIDNLQR